MEVFLTRRAEKQYQAIKKYIVGEWGSNSGKKFEQRVSLLLDLLASFPELGTLEVAHKQIRGFQLSRKPAYFTESVPAS